MSFIIGVTLISISLIVALTIGATKLSQDMAQEVDDAIVKTTAQIVINEKKEDYRRTFEQLDILTDKIFNDGTQLHLAHSRF